MPSSVRTLSGLLRVESFQLALRLLISNYFIIDPTSPHLLSSLAQQLVMQPKKNMVLIPEFPSSLPALKSFCLSLPLLLVLDSLSQSGRRHYWRCFTWLPLLTDLVLRDGEWRGSREQHDSLFIDWYLELIILHVLLHNMDQRASQHLFLFELLIFFA